MLPRITSLRRSTTLGNSALYAHGDVGMSLLITGAAASRSVSICLFAAVLWPPFVVQPLRVCAPGHAAL